MKAAALLLAAALLQACAMPMRDGDGGLTGTYQATLPAASGGGQRTVDLTLASDYGATLSSAFSGRPSRSLTKGRWASSGGELTVSLDGPRQELIVFKVEKDRLVARHWDRTTWGEAGPGTLERKR